MCESCWAWIMQEDCVLPTKHINISLVCLKECLWFTAVKSFRRRERKVNAEWEKKEMISIIDSVSCAAVSWQVSWKPLSLSAGVIVLWFFMFRWSGAMTVTNREGLCHHRSPLLLGFQCLLRGSDELLNRRGGKVPDWRRRGGRDCCCTLRLHHVSHLYCQKSDCNVRSSSFQHLQ